MGKTRLDQRQILETALDIMRDEGVEGLTMRKLAMRLGVQAPTLYWHYPDRAAILRASLKSLLIEAVVGIPPCKSWQAWMMELGIALWRIDCRRPFVTALLQSAEINNEEIFAAANELLEKAMSDFGLEQVHALRIFGDVQAIVLGWAMFAEVGVGNRLQPYFEVETAVEEGVQMIVLGWESRLSSLSA